MSSPSSPEHLADIRHRAHRMVERTRAHAGDLNQLVAGADGIAQQATALLALAGADSDPGELHRLCSAHVHRSADNAEATRRACVSAREQHLMAHRLYTATGNGAAGPAVTAAHHTAVLVVDDIQDVRDLVALVLRNAGFVVRTAVNGLEALLTAYEMRPDVIVMDLTMPVLNGIEATRLIKASEAMRASKVIAHTGDGAIPPTLERWFVAVVSKPSPPHVVLAAVQNAASL